MIPHIPQGRIPNSCSWYAPLQRPSLVPFSSEDSQLLKAGARRLAKDYCSDMWCTHAASAALLAVTADLRSRSLVDWHCRLPSGWPRGTVQLCLCGRRLCHLLTTGLGTEGLCSLSLLCRTYFSGLRSLYMIPRLCKWSSPRASSAR